MLVEKKRDRLWRGRRVDGIELQRMKCQEVDR